MATPSRFDAAVPGGRRDVEERTGLLREIARRFALLAIVLGFLITPLWLGFLAWLALKGVAWILH